MCSCSAAASALRQTSRLYARAQRGATLRSRPLATSAMAQATAAASGTPVRPEYLVLQYKYVPDILDKRGPHREAHLAAARHKAQAGKLFIAGALAEPVDGALFIWKDTSVQEVESFVLSDPYVIAGLVPDWSIRPYMVVAGSVKTA